MGVSSGSDGGGNDAVDGTLDFWTRNLEDAKLKWSGAWMDIILGKTRSCREVVCEYGGGEARKSLLKPCKPSSAARGCRGCCSRT